MDKHEKVEGDWIYHFREFVEKEGKAVPEGAPFATLIVRPIPSRHLLVFGFTLRCDLDKQSNRRVARNIARCRIESRLAGRPHHYTSELAVGPDTSPEQIAGHIQHELAGGVHSMHAGARTAFSLGAAMADDEARKRLLHSITSFKQRNVETFAVAAG